MVRREAWRRNIRKGDAVTIKPEWRDPGDERLHFVARCDEAHGEVRISTLETREWAIWPWQSVRVDMLEDN